MKILSFLPLIVILLTSCRTSNAPEAREDITRVRVAPVVLREISIPVHTSGILGPADEVRLSFKTGGIINMITVQEGQKVKKGTLLAALDLSEINSSVDQARNGYDKALRDFRRAENLYRDSVATLEMMQNATTALDVARSTLEVAEFNHRHSSIFAPADGIILKQLARSNELIAQGYPVFLFGASGKYWKVRTALSDRDVVKITAGDSAIITFDAHPSVKFRAVVGETGAMADQYTGTYEAELLMEGGNYRLAAGFIASADIFPSERKNYTLVHVGAITEADGYQGYVYAVTDSMTVMKIKVNIESMDEAAAISGLPAWVTEVVTDGAAYLKDGMKVAVIP